MNSLFEKQCLQNEHKCMHVHTQNIHTHTETEVTHPNSFSRWFIGWGTTKYNILSYITINCARGTQQVILKDIDLKGNSKQTETNLVSRTKAKWQPMQLNFSKAVVLTICVTHTTRKSVILLN